MKLISKKSGLEVKIDKVMPIIYHTDDKFIPYCTMKNESCYQTHRFKCPNYDEYMVTDE